MSDAREELVTEVNAEILSAVRELAGRQGRQIQALVDEALADLIGKHSGSARPHVMAAYLASHEKYAPLYKKLAE